MGGVMIDDFKKYIDTLIKRKLKESNGSYEKAGIPILVNEKMVEVDYALWLNSLFSQKIESIHPFNESHRDLVEILNFDVLYKQNFKSLCDIGHPAANESLAKFGVEDCTINSIIKSVEQFDCLLLDYFELFRDELMVHENSLIEVHKKITELSIDSGQGSIISHSAKMTNPACRYPRISVNASSAPDGFIRTGNSVVDFDIHINATKLKVFKFLSLKLNGVYFLDLIKEGNVEVISKVLLANETVVREWVSNFKIAINQQDNRTHVAIKQVYFPVDGDYHQLSVLTPSGLVFSLKNKIDNIIDRSKEAYIGKIAKKNNLYCKSGYSSISNLTVTRHGGEHPKNISGLNNKYQTYYLLSSSPPQLKNRSIHFPQTDFFSQTVNYFQCKQQFYQLHNLYSRDDNNMHIRADRDAYYQSVIDHIIEKMWQVRSVAAEQYIPAADQLSAAQRTWLSEQDDSKVLRETTDDWLDAIVKSVTIFVFHGYEKILGQKAIKLSETEYKQMQKLVLINKEALR
jgi:CRISPR-associated protein Csy1